MDCLDSKRLWMIMSLQSIFKQSFNRTTVLVIGGVFHETVLEYKRLGRNLRLVKGIWVETEGMKQKLVDMGYDNIEVFPNPKSEIGCCEPRVSKEKDPLRLLFFSQISKEKGVKDIIKLVHILDSSKNIKYSCGCAACATVCKRNAIDMENDEEGFKYPKINVDRCVGCNSCIKVCPLKD